MEKLTLAIAVHDQSSDRSKKDVEQKKMWNKKRCGAKKDVARLAETFTCLAIFGSVQKV